MKTENGELVEEKVVYKIRYNGDKLGLGWINPLHCNGKLVDILCLHGGVTSQYIQNVVFIKKLQQY